MKNNTEKIRENGIRESWGENETDVEENYVGKKGEGRSDWSVLISVSSLSVNVFLVLFVLVTSVLAIYYSRWAEHQDKRRARKRRVEKKGSRNLHHLVSGFCDKSCRRKRIERLDSFAKLSSHLCVSIVFHWWSTVFIYDRNLCLTSKCAVVHMLYLRSHNQL